MKNIAFLYLLMSCSSNITHPKNLEETIFPSKIILTNGFDYPVGKPNAVGYYKAQNFGDNAHLGEDWNGTGGGNTDLGDAVYACATGYVFYAKDIKGGWGNVVRVLHYLDSNTMVESLYAHLDSIKVDSGVYISKGQKIGTIGTANNHYLAHLHFEMRHKINLPIGGGYSYDTSGFLNPSIFIEANR